MNILLVGVIFWLGWKFIMEEGNPAGDGDYGDMLVGAGITSNSPDSPGEDCPMDGYATASDQEAEGKATTMTTSPPLDDDDPTEIWQFGFG